MTAPVRYRHSGRFGFGGVAMMLGVGLAVAGVGGALYGWLCAATSWPKLALIALIVVSGLIGFGSGLAAYFGKIRNPPVAALGGALCGLAALYVAWLTQLALVLDEPFALLDPATLYDEVVALAESGKHRPTKRIDSLGFTFGVWWIEATILVGVASVVSWFADVIEPFCERCGVWADDDERIGPIVLPDDMDALKADILAGRLHRLKDLEPRTESGLGVWGEIEVHACPQCGQLLVLALETVKVVLKNGNVKRTETTVVENLLVSHSLRYDLEKRFGVIPDDDEDDDDE